MMQMFENETLFTQKHKSNQFYKFCCEVSTKLHTRYCHAIRIGENFKLNFLKKHSIDFEKKLDNTQHII